MGLKMAQFRYYGQNNKLRQQINPSLHMDDWLVAINETIIKNNDNNEVNIIQEEENHKKFFLQPDDEGKYHLNKYNISNTYYLNNGQEFSPSSDDELNTIIKENHAVGVYWYAKVSEAIYSFLHKYHYLKYVKIETIPGTILYLNSASNNKIRTVIGKTGILDLDISRTFQLGGQIIFRENNIQKLYDLDFWGFVINQGSKETIDNIDNGYIIVTIVYGDEKDSTERI